MAGAADTVEARGRRPHGERARGFEPDVRHLAGMSRPSASPGERQAAEWIAERLRELGGARAQIDAEPAHGGYWWPVGLINAVAAVAAGMAARGRRWAGAAMGAVAAAALWDDTSGGSQWFRRRVLPHRDTWNVIAEMGATATAAQRTVIVMAHHDAAHSGLVFHPALPRFVPDRCPEWHARTTQTFPIMWLTWLGPLLACLGALLGGRRALLRLAQAFSLGTVAAMADIGSRAVVPGANDNLSAVAVLLALARSLRDDPPPAGLRVILLSTGSEESFMEGMRGFARHHLHGLDRATTDILCLECVGGPELIVLEGEGMLRMRDYDADAREDLAAAARRAGVELTRGIRTVAATDALIALRAGYRVAQLASVDYTRFPANYHWPSDTPDNLDWETIGRAIAVTEEWVRGRPRPTRSPAIPATPATAPAGRRAAEQEAERPQDDSRDEHEPQHVRGEAEPPEDDQQQDQDRQCDHSATPP